MKEVKFQPDYTNLLKVMYNQKPDYLPLYEHHIDAPFITNNHKDIYKMKTSSK